MSTAQVIPFKKPSQPKEQGAGKNMYSDKFEQGYVMSSRLYRKEVWPFISDAARNVYAELESRINGHLKETDYVSYSQLQGCDLPGARQLGRKTVSAGLKELIKYGIISIVGSGKQGMKSYRLNEVSIKDQFTKGTSSLSTPVPPVNQTSSLSTPVTSSLGEHTIDSSIDTLDNNEITREKFEPQNRSMMSFIEYHPRDLKSYSLKELTQTYSAQSDFQSQAKVSFPDFTDEQILSQLKKLAQWSLSAETRSPQKWMTCWLNWLSNFQNSSQTKPANNKPPAPQKPKHHRYGSGAVSGDNS
ncbi:hypothetical protein [Acinetobacter sp. ANC 5378]|uniref:hypothetical protein n=1 Tax=Acinetobacter sp. ANC 5378 TaxID=2731249 RepID=UPI00148F93A8|nr:hypothetical protein [Acinetobacter sp. ANC 5378]NNG82024.1 hypothetical protein [Acinetobacter sp. ANC 5378]